MEAQWDERQMGLAEGRHAIYLSAVDRRVIICADDVAHRTGKKTGWGSVCGVEGRISKKGPYVQNGKLLVFVILSLCIVTFIAIYFRQNLITVISNNNIRFCCSFLYTLQSLDFRQGKGQGWEWARARAINLWVHIGGDNCVVYDR